MATYNLAVYLGTNDEGFKLRETITEKSKELGISPSAYIRSLISKELGNGKPFQDKV